MIEQMKPDDKMIVFIGKKLVVDQLASKCAIDGMPVESIHGGREQCAREDAIDAFRDSEVRVLLATDVASRGKNVLRLEIEILILVVLKVGQAMKVFKSKCNCPTTDQTIELTPYNIAFYYVEYCKQNKIKVYESKIDNQIERMQQPLIPNTAKEDFKKFILDQAINYTERQ